MTDPLRELVLPRLQSVKKSGHGFMAKCPAHNDGTASLSISTGTSQPVVFHCHANCPSESILEQLGLTWAELSNPDPVLSGDNWTPVGPAIAIYEYRDETGKLLFEVLRTATKDFRQRTPDPTTKTGHRWNLDGVRRVPYRLPQLAIAVAAGRVIFVCEGEKDADALTRLGQPATCNPGGAGKWRDDYNIHFRDAHVVIIPDRDEPGRAHARQVRDALLETAATIRICETADGTKDISEHIAGGNGLESLVTTWNSHPETPIELAQDLWEFLATTDPPYDWVIPDLIEHADRLILTGFEGLGKSMLIRQLAVTMAAGFQPFSNTRITQQNVLLIDCENTPRQSRRRFRALATAADYAGRRVPDGGLRIIHRPGGIDLTTKNDADWLTEQTTAHKPDALIIGPFYQLHRANLNEELPARKVAAVLDKVRENTNAAIIIEAHAGHAETSLGKRSVRPTGSSLLLRWPEFGYGLRPASEDSADTLAVQAWRGPRDERRWPTHITRSNPWPWAATTPPTERQKNRDR